MHSHWPELLNYKTEVHAETPQHNLELAFAAFKQKGIEGLLDPEGKIYRQNYFVL